MCFRQRRRLPLRVQVAPPKVQRRAKVQEARARVMLRVGLSQVQVPLLQEEQVQVQVLLLQEEQVQVQDKTHSQV